MDKVFSESDTIAAIASGMTNAGVGIIRISGPKSIAIADKIYSTNNGLKASELADHKLCLGRIASNNEVADEALLVVMRAPHSYTGEDVVEIQCHGGIFLCKKILKLVIDAGARLADPGEFTKRAFLNGKLDLSQAEAVMDLIKSQNDFAARNSIEQLGGSIRDKIAVLRGSLLHECAYIEAALDDPEHYELNTYSDEFASKLTKLISDIEHLIVVSKRASVYKEGIRTAIVGKPNAGKSSLLNMLCGRDAAIVTDVAGTTRDTIEESVLLSDIQLRLIDTAGIRNTSDVVERIGVERSRAAVDGAELVFFVIDSSLAMDENDREIASILSDKNVIIIMNKSDLEPKLDKRDIYSLLGKEDICIVKLSAKNGEGFDELVDAVSSIYISLDLNDELVITNLRQRNELEASLKSLNMVLEAINNSVSEDLYIVDLIDAYKHLGYILGEELEDDLVDKVFKDFCIGK